MTTHPYIGMKHFPPFPGADAEQGWDGATFGPLPARPRRKNPGIFKTHEALAAAELLRHAKRAEGERRLIDPRGGR